MSETILEMKHITKRFPGVVALNDVSLTINKGEIHAVIGENGAGKSTLMKILIGLYDFDEGTITLNGEDVRFRDPKEALSKGVSMIHQEMSLVPTMTVAENIWLGQENRFSTCGIINKNKMVQATRELLEKWKLNVEADELISKLSIAKMQLVELARALSFDAQIIIMDEPTSALTETEVDQLFEIIRRLVNDYQKSVIFISHKLNEIFEIADTISVYRDGTYINTFPTAQLKMEELMNMIAGRELSAMFPKLPAEIGDVVLEVDKLTRTGVFSDISFQLRKGEILGFCGLMGAGRTEIMRGLFGIDKIDSGKVYVHGKEVINDSPSASIRNGFGMVTEDRLRMGSIHNISVIKNTTLSYFDNLCNKIGVYNPGEEMDLFTDVAAKLTVKYSDPEEKMKQLSGGNQQKVILARWLLCDPDILILDEPTRGIDVGAKAEIHRLISLLAQQGKAIILVSSEMPEILGMSDRVVVVREGRIVHECDISEADQEELMAYAFGTKEADTAV